MLVVDNLNMHRLGMWSGSTALYHWFLERIVARALVTVAAVVVSPVIVLSLVDAVGWLIR